MVSNNLVDLSGGNKIKGEPSCLNSYACYHAVDDAGSHPNSPRMDPYWPIT